MSKALDTNILEYLIDQGIELSQASLLIPIYVQIAEWIIQQRHTGITYLLGVNGAQGSGKSTLSGAVALILKERHLLNIADFSLDDLYKTRDERMHLAQTLHPLLITRGVPGTHDIELGLNIIENLCRKEPIHVALPVFDKGIDDRLPMHEWKSVTTPVDIVILEGWCVGALPQSENGLHNPVNELERVEDSGSVWREYVNSCLATLYQTLFAKLDGLIMLKVPNMACIYEWRGLQEKKLASLHAGKSDVSIMTATQLNRFIMHYERLTRHMLDEMPDRADLTLFIDKNHNFTHIQTK